MGGKCNVKVTAKSLSSSNVQYRYRNIVENVDSTSTSTSLRRSLSSSCFCSSFYFYMMIFFCVFLSSQSMQRGVFASMVEINGGDEFCAYLEGHKGEDIFG